MMPINVLGGGGLLAYNNKDDDGGFAYREGRLKKYHYLQKVKSLF